MTTRQVGASVQNDGNFAHLDQLDDTTGVLRRVEVFRASQPSGEFGTTGVGSAVADICGKDHLAPGSYRIHRFLYSEGETTGGVRLLLEGREEFDPEGLPPGSADIRLRDVDAASSTFGKALRAVVVPADAGDVRVTYEAASFDGDAVELNSPLHGSVAAQSGLSDLATVFGPASDEERRASGGLTVSSSTSRGEISAYFEHNAEALGVSSDGGLADNCRGFMVFGNLGPKSVHPGQNLIGSNPSLMADLVVIRSYRQAMIAFGRPFLPDMAAAADAVDGPIDLLAGHSCPGVYAIHVLGHVLNIRLYQLVLDKVYSDYSGVPLRLRPGSRIETGDQPLFDSLPANRTIARLAEAYYLR